MTMNILLHTVALEPERWTPKRVSRPLEDLLQPIAAAGFHDLEIYEPHLGRETVSSSIKDRLQSCGLRPVILSSYLNLNPTVTSEADVEAAASQIAERIGFYGFTKLRLFAGGNLRPDDTKGVAGFTKRVARLADQLGGTEILLETHDGSVADDPPAIVRVIKDIARANVGLLFQPTYFDDPARTLEQFRLQRPHIRHLHLQNRNPDLTFARMREGVVPWPAIFAMGGAALDATLEFVPTGICPVESFDLAVSLDEAVRETGDVLDMASDAKSG